MQFAVKQLTPNSFTPYGTVIEQLSGSPEATGPGWSWWSETALLPLQDRPYAVGYLHLTPQPLAFDWAERHLHSVEAIIPLGGDCLVYVGPPDQMPTWNRFDVFQVRPGQAVILNVGIWHGAPLAIDRPLNALVLLRQGTGMDDVAKATCLDGPIQIVHDPIGTE